MDFTINLTWVVEGGLVSGECPRTFSIEQRGRFGWRGNMECA